MRAGEEQAIKILIVDGDASRHSGIAEILTKRGCDLFEVGGGEEALRIAREVKPAIAIVDLLTPELDRGDFVRQVRSDPAIARMPVIFYTDGYLEIASGVTRDGESLLTPMLLCEEAIRGKAIVELIAPVVSANGNGKNGRHAAESIQETFIFACATGGERARINPGELMTEVIDNARKVFPKTIQITSAYSEDLWQIEGDRVQLHRVLTNLLRNARQAMPQGGLVVVSARNFDVDQRYASMTLGAELGQYVMLRVSDTGRGTPRSVIDNIFTPFLERKVIGPGTSLGLIKSHGGFMSVYSRFGKGTTFQIFLPAKVVEEPSPKRKRTGQAKRAVSQSAS